MNRSITTVLAFCAVAVVAQPRPAEAHHSFAMYDPTRLVTLKGTIKSLLWSNPHVVIWLIREPVTGEATQTWTLELSSPGYLARYGWSRTSLKPGDPVEMQIFPLRSGDTGGSLRTVKILSTGQVLYSNANQGQSSAQP